MSDDGALDGRGQVQFLKWRGVVGRNQVGDEPGQDATEVLGCITRQLAGQDIDRHDDHARPSNPIGRLAGHRIVDEGWLARFGRTHRRFDSSVDVATDVADDVQAQAASRQRVAQIGPGHQPRVQRCPVDRVDQHVQMRQVLLEDAVELLGVLVIAMEIEGLANCQRRGEMLLAKGGHIEYMARRSRIGGQSGQIARRHFLHRQMMQDIPDAAGDVAIARHADRQRRNARRQAGGSNGIRGNVHIDQRLSQIAVLVWLSQPGERVGGALPGQTLPQRAQRLQHPGDPGVPAEKDQSPPRVVGDFFVVDQRTAKLQQSSQHRHIVWLPLDDVREKDVSLARHEDVFGDFLDGQHHRTRRQVFIDLRAGLPKFVIGKCADRRWLHARFDAVAHAQLARDCGRHRDAPLPNALILPPHTDGCHGCCSSKCKV